jgi:isopenicillin-N epimerase
VYITGEPGSQNGNPGQGGVCPLTAGHFCERKAARLRYLRDRWARRLAAHPRVKILTSFDPQQSCGLGVFSVEGLDPNKLVAHLWENHRIIVSPIVHAEFSGIRVTPNVYTTLEEVDTFCSAVEGALQKGI